MLKKEDLNTWVNPHAVIRPNKELRQRYNSLYENYLDLYTQNREIIHRLADYGR